MEGESRDMNLTGDPKWTDRGEHLDGHLALMTGVEDSIRAERPLLSAATVHNGRLISTSMPGQVCLTNRTPIIHIFAVVDGEYTLNL